MTNSVFKTREDVYEAETAKEFLHAIQKIKDCTNIIEKIMGIVESEEFLKFLSDEVKAFNDAEALLLDKALEITKE